MDDQDLDDLLEDTLGEFSDEIASHPGLCPPLPPTRSSTRVARRAVSCRCGSKHQGVDRSRANACERLRGRSGNFFLRALSWRAAPWTIARNDELPRERRRTHSLTVSRQGLPRLCQPKKPRQPQQSARKRASRPFQRRSAANSQP